MDNTLDFVVPRNSESKYCHASVYNRVDAVNNDNKPSNNRDYRARHQGCSRDNLQWYKHNSWRYWWYRFRQCDLHTDNQRSRLGSTDHNQRSWNNRNNLNRKRNRNRQYHYILLYLLSITSPAFAEGETHNNSNPVAAATGNVTNQAVQFQNNGAQSRQFFGPNISCNGSTMTFQPFYMGNHSKPLDEFMQPTGYTLAENWGFQINFMVPLDKSGYKQCKEIAKRQEEKMRLDYELVRALKCAELQQKGFTIRPGTRVYGMCSDIVPIQSLIKEDVSTTKTNRFNFFKK